MAKGFSISLTPDSISKTIRSYQQFESRVTDRIGKALYQTGINIQKDSKIDSPVKYGVLRSSIYVDWKRITVKRLELKPGNPGPPSFPAPESQSDGMDVIVGSIVEYGPTMDRFHPTQAGFFSSAVNYHVPRVEQAIDNIIQRETKL
jgi:hypothetical protein